MPQKCNLAFGKYANNYFSANQEITAYENNFLFLFFFFTTNEMKICLCLVKSTVSPEYCPPPSPCPPPTSDTEPSSKKKKSSPLVVGQCYCRECLREQAVHAWLQFPGSSVLVQRTRALLHKGFGTAPPAVQSPPRPHQLTRTVPSRASHTYIMGHPTFWCNIPKTLRI